MRSRRWQNSGATARGAGAAITIVFCLLAAIAPREAHARDQACA